MGLISYCLTDFANSLPGSIVTNFKWHLGHLGIQVFMVEPDANKNGD